MNLTRVLDVALPEIPSRTLVKRYPRIDPDVVSQEHIEDGKPVVRLYIPSAGGMYTFPAAVWPLIQLFDGKRSYEEIAALHSEQSGVTHGVEEVREMADHLESVEFWYKTPMEKNVLLMQKSADGRRKQQKKKSKYGDLSEILFPALNPDGFLTWLHKYTRFIYTWWFTLITLAVFGFAAGITIAHWSEVGRDTLEFFNFTHKSWLDVLQYYLLTIIVVAIHETAHGHACKHYGGRVPTMGFALVYLLPAFYTDTTEGDVKGSRSGRFVISMAGVWSELMLYSIVTPIWWGTPPDTAVHNTAYFLMLVSGISTLLLNWNPLMKLDGYYMLIEILGIVDLKENSTEYVSAWVKNHVWGLPVEVPYVPRRRRFGYAFYAILSGLYSYTVLYILARFAGNVFRNFSPEWSFIPEFATAGFIFRSRIRTLVNFMKFLYLDKRDRVLTRLKSQHALKLAGIVIVLMLLPLWHESARGRFILEPAQRAVLRNVVPGMITDVYAEEGQPVTAGEALFRMRNLPLQSKLARSNADFGVAYGRATSAALRYADFGPAFAERDRIERQTHELAAEASNLELKSPISGVVVTPHVRDILGSYVAAGTQLIEVDTLDQMRARIFIPESDMYKFALGASARLQVEGLMGTRAAHIVAIAPASSEIDTGLVDRSRYEGLRPPNFFVVDLLADNPDGRLRPGMIGTARVYGQLKSLAGFAAREAVHIFARKLW